VGVEKVDAVTAELPAKEQLSPEQATTGPIQKPPGRAWGWRVEDDRRERKLLPVEEPLGEHNRPHALEGKKRPVNERL
jgi:hypothetical protein